MSKIPVEQIDLCFDQTEEIAKADFKKQLFIDKTQQNRANTSNVFHFRKRDTLSISHLEINENCNAIQRILQRVKKF